MSLQALGGGLAARGFPFLVDLRAHQIALRKAGGAALTGLLVAKGFR